MRPAVIPRLLDLGVQQLGMHHGNHSKLVDVTLSLGLFQFTVLFKMLVNILVNMQWKMQVLCAGNVCLFL